MTSDDRFSSYQYGEGRTGTGQLVEFSCRPEEVGQVREFLQRLRTVSLPTTGRVTIPHGGFGRHTRYQVRQHDYAGGDGGGWGYIEVLTVENPPDGRWGVIIHEAGSVEGSIFTEWETLEEARSVFMKYWCSNKTAEEFPKLPGFKRRVVCGPLTPWFYAIGDEELIGDYALSNGMQDDPVYRLGERFIVSGEGTQTVKTCLGTRFVRQKQSYPPYRERQYRLVYWDDGSVWDESNHLSNPPRPLQEGELWITEAVWQFQRVLAGRQTDFKIAFTDGTVFVGKLANSKQQVPCAEGDYLVTVHLKGEQNPQKGWVQNFHPTQEVPNIIQYVTRRYAESGREVERIEVTKNQKKRNGRKWSGVFFSPSPRS